MRDFAGIMVAVMCAAMAAASVLALHDDAAADHPSLVGAGLNVATTSTAWTTTHYDGCNWTTCAGGSCSTTLRACGAWSTFNVESPETGDTETGDTATIGTRQYETIRITAPGYRCARDGDGWTCMRGAP